MSKSKRISVTITEEHYEVAKALNMNLSQTLRDAIMDKLGAMDSPEAIELEINKLDSKKSMLNRELTRQKEIDNKIKEKIGTDDLRLEKALNDLYNVFERKGELGKDMILFKANQYKIDYHDLLENLPDEIRMSIVDRALAEPEDPFKEMTGSI